MSGRMSCDCGWSGEIGAEQTARPRCPDCHAPLIIPPLPPDPLEYLGPATVKEPSAAVRLARRRQARERDGDESSRATTEADEPLDQAERRSHRYRPSLFLSPRALRGLGLLLIGSVVLTIELSQDRIPIFAILFLLLGTIKLFLAFRGSEES